MEKARTFLKNLLLLLVPKLGRVNSYKDFDPRIVVLVNWENLGDFVLFSAVIREVRSNFPKSKLFVVAQRENRGLVEFCPYVDRWIWVKGHRKPKRNEGHGKSTSYQSKMFLTYFLLILHGHRKVDLLLGPDWLLVKEPNQFSENFLFRIVNFKRNQLIDAASNRSNKYNDHCHQVERMLSILDMYGLKVTSQDIENWTVPSDQISKGPDERGNREEMRILISLGAGQLRRNWPLPNVVKLAELLAREFSNANLTILGPPSFDQEEIGVLFSTVKNVQNLVGKTTLRQVSEIMLDSDLMVSNDSGLVHIAASLKLPCVVVSAHPVNGDPWNLHSPNRYHPWRTRYVELQPASLLSPCMSTCQSDGPHCITTVTPNEVFQACKSILIDS